MNKFFTKVTDIKYLAGNVLELKVELEDPKEIQFEPGQFMQFVIGESRRPYSIISTPRQQNSLSFLIELLPEGLGSDYVKCLKVGDRVLMNGPFGIMTAKQFDRDYCFVAAGVGIAPFISIIPEMLRKGFNKQITLIFGAREESRILYFDYFCKLQDQYPNFKFIPTVSQPSDCWTGTKGRVTEFLGANYEQYSSSLFYLCGSKEMVADTRQILIKKGHNPLAIKLEIFV